jgi:hypothetical protein
MIMLAILQVLSRYHRSRFEKEGVATDGGARLERWLDLVSRQSLLRSSC